MLASRLQCGVRESGIQADTKDLGLGNGRDAAAASWDKEGWNKEEKFKAEEPGHSFIRLKSEKNIRYPSADVSDSWTDEPRF